MDMNTRNFVEINHLNWLSDGYYWFKFHPFAKETLVYVNADTIFMYGIAKGSDLETLQNDWPQALIADGPAFDERN